jgi:hypothetical protein
MPTIPYQSKYIKHQDTHTTHDATSITAWAIDIIYNNYTSRSPHQSNKKYHETIICAFCTLY